jgi:voltage-gated potassium channel
VGYGDTVPTTLASKVFAVFVVLLGYGVLSLVTAAIASSWVETEEQQREREFLREMHREIASLRQELVALRKTMHSAQSLGSAAPTARDGATAPEEGHQK